LLKGRMFLVVRILVTVGLVVGLCVMLGPDNLKKLPDHVAHADIGLLALAFVALIAGTLCGSLRWWLLLRRLGVHMNLRRAVFFFFMGYFFNNLLPSSVGGDAVKAYYVVRASGKKREPIASVIMDRGFGMAALICVAGLATVLAPPSMQLVGVKTTLGIVAIVAIVLIALVAVEPVTERTLMPILRLLHQEWRGRRFFRLVRGCLRPSATSGGALLLSFCAWQTTILMFYFVCRSVVGPVPIGYFYLFVPLVALVSTLPVTIAGIGLAEMSIVGLFKILEGIGEADAMAAALLARAVMIAGALLGWIVFAFKDDLGLGHLPGLGELKRMEASGGDAPAEPAAADGED